MAALILRLRLDLFLGAFRGDSARVLRTIAGGLFAIVGTIAVCMAVFSLSERPAPVAEAVTILFGAALTLGFAVAPAVSGVEDQLDPRRFALSALAPRPLAGSLLLGAVVSVPSLALLAVCVSFAAMWSARGVNPALAWVAALIGYATCVLFARVSMALVAMLLPARRSREMTGLFMVAIIVVIVPIAVFLSSLDWGGVVPSPLDDLVSFLAVTPFGAVWAVAAGDARGDGGFMGMTLAIALATLAVLVWAWFALVARMLVSIERPLGDRGRDGLGWFAITPGTPGGAVAARSLVYWLRDRRYLVNVVIVPFASVIAALPLLVAGVPAHVVALVPVPIMALFLGWMPHNDVAYDSTAVWLHIVSGVRGISDRIGRLVPIILLSVPLLAIAVTVSAALYGRWAVMPALVGVAVVLFLCGLGLSSISSVLSPYPVTRPGDSPFQQPQRSGSGFGSQGLVLIGAIAFSIPTLWYAWRAITEDLSLATTAMWVGIGSGLLVCALGLTVGALLFDRRGSHVMEFAEAI